MAPRMRKTAPEDRLADDAQKAAEVTGRRLPRGRRRRSLAPKGGEERRIFSP
jgi:hypothetical protein